MRRWTVPFACAPIICLSLAGCSQKPPDYAARAVPLSRVDITDEFWSPRLETNRSVSIQHCFRKLEETKRSDLRLIEAAAYMLAKRGDPALEQYTDALIGKAVTRLQTQKSDLVSGDFLLASVAYYEATGKRKMLDAAVKAADATDAAYGPGKKPYISGHEGMKMGLMRLYRQTGDARYWKLAKFFLDQRGRNDYPRKGEYAIDRTYAQDDKPVVQQRQAEGHAVRATYLYISLADVAALSGEPAYAHALDSIWADAVYRKTYITGGIGSVRFHEQFGAAFELPNLSAWNETCAAYGNVVWNHRMFLLRREAKYVDVMERVLYNALLDGVSLKGDRFFYQNPLKSFGNYERFDWINVPCCPPNLVRLLASLGSYIYAQDEEGIYVNLFVGSKARIQHAGTTVEIEQKTRYPWDGAVRIRVGLRGAARFPLYVRVPGWTANQVLPGGGLYRFVRSEYDPVRLKVNGAAVNPEMMRGYARIERTWTQGDAVELDLPMPVRRVEADPRVKEDEGLVALERGPLVYCAEWPDNAGRVLNIVLPDSAGLKHEFRKDLLNGVEVIEGDALAVERTGKGIETRPHPLVAIPYYAWANRGMGEMEVWMARRPERARVTPVPADPIARVQSSGGIEKKWTGYNDQNDDIAAVYDGVDPLNSADESNLYFRMRPPLGQPAWVEYDFKRPTRISSSEVYFVDDRRFCRLPASWRIVYKEGATWKPVATSAAYGVEKDRFNAVAFQPVITTAVRIEVEPRTVHYKTGEIGPPDAMFLSKDADWREFGIIEWRVR
jgi:DUF1680 family protein